MGWHFSLKNCKRWWFMLRNRLLVQSMLKPSDKSVKCHKQAISIVLPVFLYWSKSHTKEMTLTNTRVYETCDFIIFTNLMFQSCQVQGQHQTSSESWLHLRRQFFKFIPKWTFHSQLADMLPKSFPEVKDMILMTIWERHYKFIHEPTHPTWKDLLYSLWNCK
jgi:hypothetical protein